MADHQPAMGPQDRDVVGDGLGVRRSDADVDETDPAPVGAHAMIGGHLEPVPGDGGCARFRLRRRDRRVDDDVARQDDFLDAGSCVQLLQAPVHELVDVAVIVGEQHPRLHRPPVGAGVVHEAAQRIIDARARRTGRAAARGRSRTRRPRFRRRSSPARGRERNAPARPRRRRRASVRRRFRSRKGRGSPARRRRPRSWRRIR